MGSRDDKKREMENRIYDIAMDLFCENGYEKTSLVDIASHSHVSTRTLYRYFPTKEWIVRRFARENLLAMERYADELSSDMPVRDKIIELMAYDYHQMFCLFDVTFVLSASRDTNGVFTDFELENFKITENIYQRVLQQEQLKRGVTSGGFAHKAAIVLMALYRHATDRMRFEHSKMLDRESAKKYYGKYVDIVWDSLYENLNIGNASPPPLESD